MKIGVFSVFKNCGDAIEKMCCKALSFASVKTMKAEGKLRRFFVIASKGALSPMAVTKVCILTLMAISVVGSPFGIFGDLIADAAAATTPIRASDSGFGSGFCNVYLLATSDAMRIFAALAIMSTCLVAIAGKIAFTTCAILAFSITVAFSGLKIVQFLTQSNFDAATCGTAVQSVG